MINKIVFTSPEAMVEFSRENESLRSSKILLTCVNYIRLNIGQGIFFLRGKQTSRITNHARKRESRFA